MDVVKEQKDALNATLKIKLSPVDYEDRVNKAIKATQKRVQMPGFRQGMVPMGMVKKMYGKSILADELNKILYDSLNKYIAENKIEILGNPIPKAEDSGIIDFESQKEFEFSYDLGLAPQFDIDFAGAPAINYYKILVDEALQEKYIKDIRRRYGNVESPEKVEENDLVYCELKELNEDKSVKENGISVISYIALDSVKSEDLKKNLIGEKKDHEFVVASKDLSDNSTDLAAMLKISKEQAEGLNCNFEGKISNISRMVPAEFNQDLWDKVYGKDKIKSAEEFKAKLSDELLNMFGQDSDRRFKYDVSQYFISKLNLHLPDEFLKRWIVTANEKPVTMEQVNNEYESYSRSLKNQLVENKIIKDSNIKVEAAEAMEFTKQMLKDQYFRYSPEAVDDEFLTETAQKVLAKPEDANRVYERVYDNKILNLYKEKFKINEVALPYDEFVKKLNEA